MKKNVLSTVSVAAMRGPVDQLIQNIANPLEGPYWLRQLNRLLRKEPTHVMTKEWLKELEDDYTWKKAEKFFREKKKLWYNEAEWPFQIAVLKIGGMEAKTVRKELKERNLFNDDIEKVFDQVSFLSQKTLTIQLIRIQPRIMGFLEKVSRPLLNDFSYLTTTQSIQTDIPVTNFRHLHRCPTETALRIQLQMQDFEQEIDQVTFVAMLPLETKEGKQMFKFGHYGNGEMWLKTTDTNDDTTAGIDSYWIYQYLRNV